MTQLNALMLARGQDTIIDNVSISTATDYNLPSTVRKGQVYLVLSEVTNNALLTIKSSDGDTVETIRNGYCLVVAKQDTPTDATHWKVADVYEDGTWIPTATFTVPGTVSSGSQNGWYTRQNRLVTFGGILSITKGTGSGNITITGLPYQSAAYYTTNSSTLENRTAAPANFRDMYGYIGPNSQAINLEWNANTTTQTAQHVQAADLGTLSVDCLLGGSYLKA